ERKVPRPGPGRGAAMRPKPDVLYRARLTADRGKPISASELAGAVFVEFPADRPRDTISPKGEWYCSNPDCVVREVTVRAKLCGDGMPQTSTCPVCREPMEFRHWLHEEMLLPVGRATQ